MAYLLSCEWIKVSLSDTAFLLPFFDVGSSFDAAIRCCTDFGSGSFRG